MSKNLSPQQLWGAGATLAIVVLVIVLVAPPDRRIAREGAEAHVEPVAFIDESHHLRIAAGSFLDGQLERISVRSEQVQEPVVSAPGHVVARIVPGDDPVAERWVFSYGELGELFTEWMMAVDEEQLDAEMLALAERMWAQELVGHREALEAVERMLALHEELVAQHRELVTRRAALREGHVALLRQREETFEAQEVLVERQRGFLEAQREVVAEAQLEFERMQRLVEIGAEPQRELAAVKRELAEELKDLAELELDIATAEWELLEAKLELAEARLELEEFDVESHEAQMEVHEASMELEELRAERAEAAHELALAEIERETELREAQAELLKAQRERLAMEREMREIGLDPRLLVRHAEEGAVLVAADVPERRIGLIREGQASLVSLVGLERATWRASVLGTAEALDPESRTLRALLRLDGEAANVRAGMFAEVGLGVEPREVVTVPSEAVLHVGRYDYVVVQNGQGWQPVRVRLGETRGERIEVLSGLQAGDTVIGRGAILIKPFVVRALQQASTEEVGV